ncbi:MAG: ABC transporter ATP-binding protein [Planctomycetes bacterium]|nr:ABC transporter ATP-binding protein [Planctomycetota bacterium]
MQLSNVSKRYRGARPGTATSASEAGAGPERPGEVWALWEVSFAPEKGKFYGVLGRNGAGKTTLLRVMAGLTAPTSGRVTPSGRIAVVIEPGGGFFPEFSGVDNVFLYGSLLGFTERELKNRFETISRFADLGAALFHPVRTYSLGMTLRLAFAVAVAVEPDLFLLDEAMLVGDIAFQARCFERVREMRARGVSIVYATHDYGALYAIADEVIWLDEGRVREHGAPQHAIAHYVNSVRATPAPPPGEVQRASRTGAAGGTAEAAGGDVRAARAEVLDGRGQPCEEIEVGDALEFRAGFDLSHWRGRAYAHVKVMRNDGLECYATSSRWQEVRLEGGGRGCVALRFPSLALLPGDYVVRGLLVDDGTGHILIPEQEMARFRVRLVQRWGLGVGVAHLPHEWRVVKEAGAACC